MSSKYLLKDPKFESLNKDHKFNHIFNISKCINHSRVMCECNTESRNSCPEICKSKVILTKIPGLISGEFVLPFHYVLCSQNTKHFDDIGRNLICMTCFHQA